jgi:hypothetical protein
MLLRRLQGEDRPGAQEPHELRAVVDVPTDPPAPAAGRPSTPASTVGDATLPPPA